MIARANPPLPAVANDDHDATTDDETADDLDALLAASEACANSVQHAFRPCAGGMHWPEPDRSGRRDR